MQKFNGRCCVIGCLSFDAKHGLRGDARQGIGFLYSSTVFGAVTLTLYLASRSWLA